MARYADQSSPAATFVALAAFVALGHTGCFVDVPNPETSGVFGCKTDRDCFGGFVCVDGRCYSAKRGDSKTEGDSSGTGDAAGGDVDGCTSTKMAECLTSGSACRDENCFECVTAQDCPAEYTCVPDVTITKRCLKLCSEAEPCDPGEECIADSCRDPCGPWFDPCPPGSTCAPSSGRLELHSEAAVCTGCAADNDCPASHACVESGRSGDTICAPPCGTCPGLSTCASVTSVSGSPVPVCVPCPGCTSCVASLQPAPYDQAARCDCADTAQGWADFGGSACGFGIERAPTSNASGLTVGVDGSNVPWVAFREEGIDAVPQISVYYWDAVTGVWRFSQIDRRSSDASLSAPSLVDVAATVHVAWTETLSGPGSTSHVYVAQWASPAWVSAGTSTTSEESNEGEGINPSENIAASAPHIGTHSADALAQPVVTWVAGGSISFVGRGATSAWNVAPGTVSSPGIGDDHRSPRIAFDPLNPGTNYVAYVAWDFPETGQSSLRVAMRTTGAWQDTTPSHPSLNDPSVSLASDPDIAVVDDQTVVSWVRQVSGSLPVPVAAVWADGFEQWLTLAGNSVCDTNPENECSPLTPSGDAGYEPAIASTGTDLYATWVSESAGVHVRSYDGGAFGTNDTALDMPLNDGGIASQPAIAVNGTRVCVAWLQELSGRKLVYLRCLDVN